MKKKAVILLSGGIDSVTTAAIAKDLGYELYAISFNYGQRHKVELDFAKKSVKSLSIKEHKIANIDLTLFGGSALTDNIEVPKNHDINKREIPVTYVPARNTIFLSYSLAYSEVIGAFDIFNGANIIDYSGYPDCRPEFMESFENTANLGTKAGIVGQNKFKIHTPLIKMDKSEIIQKGLELGVDYSLTISCYDPNKFGNSCGECDSCQIRKNAFNNLNLNDPTKYYLYGS